MLENETEITLEFKIYYNPEVTINVLIIEQCMIDEISAFLSREAKSPRAAEEKRGFGEKLK
jgi:hypothetical protein